MTEADLEEKEEEFILPPKLLRTFVQHVVRQEQHRDGGLTDGPEQLMAHVNRCLAKPDNTVGKADLLWLW